MIQRAPSWMWVTLAGIVISILIIGIATTFSGGGNDDAKAAPAMSTGSSIQVGQRKTYTLLGFDQKIGPVVDMNQLPAGSHVRPWGTSGAEACFDDGSCGSIANDFGVRGGQVWLRGPAGGTVTIDVTPP